MLDNFLVSLIKMDQLPSEIEAIIRRYKKDMELLDQTPKDCITPLLMLPQLVTNCDHMLLKMFTLARTSFPLIANVLNFPSFYIDDYEQATRLWRQRLKLYGLPVTNLAPFWEDTIPYILMEYFATFDTNLLESRLKYYLWANDADYICLL